MIISVEPADIEHAPVIVASSDAPDNDSAIRDIDEWARDHGFVRRHEYHLGVRLTPARKFFRYSACYRLTAEDLSAANADVDRIKARLNGMPMTTSSDALLRED